MDLTTRYLGLTLRNPLVASAGPIARTVPGVQRLARAGVAAVVLPSLFEEQILAEAERDAALGQAGTDSFAEALTYLPATDGDVSTRQCLSLIERATAAADIPVIASLNGVSPGGWTGYAMVGAGAAAIELNIYYLPGDPLTPGAGRRAAPPRHPRRGQGRGRHSGRSQARPLLQLRRGDRAPAG